MVLRLVSVSVVIQPAWQGDLNSTPSEPQTGLKASSGHRQPALHDNASDLKTEMWWKRFSYQAFRSKKLLLTVLYHDSDTNHLCARSIDLVLINQHDESIRLLGLKFYLIFFKVSLQQPYSKQTKKSFQEVGTYWSQLLKIAKKNQLQQNQFPASGQISSLSVETVVSHSWWN